MNGECCAVLEVLSGPEDGYTVPIANERFVLGPRADALLKLEYDNHVPEEGFEICIREEKLVVAGLGEIPFNQPFQVGRVWLRVLKAREG